MLVVNGNSVVCLEMPCGIHIRRIKFCKMALNSSCVILQICKNILDTNMGDVLRIVYVQRNPQLTYLSPIPTHFPCIVDRDVAMVMDWMCCCGQSVIMACRPPWSILDYLDTKRARISNKGSSTRQATFLMLIIETCIGSKLWFPCLVQVGTYTPLCHLSLLAVSHQLTHRQSSLKRLKILLSLMLGSPLHSLKDYVAPLVVLKCSFLLLLLDIENIVQHVDNVSQSVELK